MPGHDLKGRGLFEHIHVADRPAFLKAIADAATGSNVAPVTLRLRTTMPTGHAGKRGEATFRTVEMRSRRYASEASANTEAPARGRVVSILRDVTVAKQREEELESIRFAHEETNVWKDDFSPM